jgi:predicted lysophospholipase L1 biosynthesis ABC-type transport system permease subunit
VPRQTDEDVSRAARTVTHRAVRRLGLLETMLILAAGVFALAAGAVTAFLLADVAGVPFRTTWIVASVLYFAVPALGVAVRGRREDAALRVRLDQMSPTEPTD